MALPPGIPIKTVTIGTASFFDGTLVDGTVTITAPVNVVHTPSNRPIFSSSMSQRFVDGVATFNLAATDAAGLNRVDWTYKANIAISGAGVQPDPIYFTLPTAGPDTIDLDGLVTVPSSAGIPISVDALTTADLPAVLPGLMTDVAADRNSAFSVAQRATFDARFAPFTTGAPLRGVPVGDGGITTGDFTARTTSATHRCPHYVNVAATDLRFEWHNWRNNGTSATPNYADVDGAAPVTIRASVEVGGTIYRLTFGGRTDVTIDPGGFVQSDPLPLDVPAGALIYSRTFVVSGSWHYTRYSLVGTGSGGVSTAAADLTAPGSAAIPDSTFAAMFAPTAITGKALGAATVPSVLVIGDSIGAGAMDYPGTIVWQGRNVTNPQLHGGGFLMRAFHGKTGFVNAAVPGSTVQGFLFDSGHFRRMTFARNVSTMVCEYGRNDISGGRTTAQLQADLLTAWKMGAQRGLRVIQTTITPKTTSTDGWRTTANQVTASAPQEAVRVAVNDWIRDGAPIVSAANPTAVATGTVGALRAGGSGHPLFGYWEVADRVESARNSGLWKPWVNTRTVTDAAIGAGGNGLTSATAAFTSADLGRLIYIAGAGTAGGDYYSMIQQINSATTANPNANAVTAVSGATAVIGDGNTGDGTHPSPYFHTLMAAGCDLSLLA